MAFTNLHTLSRSDLWQVAVESAARPQRKGRPVRRRSHGPSL